MSQLPAILIADPDEDGWLAQSIERRFGRDYEILAERTGASGLARLAELEGGGAPVALVLAVRRLPDISWESFLNQAHPRCPTARRALVVGWTETWGPIADAREDLIRAAALGVIDSFLVTSGGEADERFYAAVSDVLAAWAGDTAPRFEAVRVVGERWAEETHALRDVLHRSSVPAGFYDADSPEGQRLLATAGAAGPLPVAILHDGRVLSRPTAHEIASAFGLGLDERDRRSDIVVVGAGPAGLAAAVNAASEGLEVTVVEGEAHGGQAGTSSMIRNYLGFPRGISGAELSARAFSQAVLFGTQFLIGRRAVELRSEDEIRVVVLDDGTELRSRAVVLAMGVSYRRLGERLDRFVGRGVYYGAAMTEAPAMRGEPAVVVGGANSAGQAAVYLARFASSVTLIVRGPSLEIGMSDYLIRELEALPNVAVRTASQVVDADGHGRLEAVVVRDDLGATERLPAVGAFVLIGAVPRTDWLPEAIARDESGYVRTSSASQGSSPFATGIEGVFAVGDVRAGSVKRVASAVGEGSVVVPTLHKYLARTAAAARGGTEAAGGTRA